MTRMERTLRACSLFITLVACAAAQATHLVGGNLGYAWLGETAPGSGIYRYRVIMEFYMNCGANSNFENFQELLDLAPGGQLPVGVYSEDPQAPGADKDLLTTVGLDLVDEGIIEPGLPDNCTVGEGLCTRRGRFEGLVDLPLSFAGYHLYFQMCCRNLDITNLQDPNGTGIGYYAFIPATPVPNDSPTFLGLPTPFLCAGDTSTFVNAANDADGDLLIFSFETPYNSVSQQGGVQPPPGELPWPVPEVTHAAGFSTAQPFGTGGYSYINGATGLTEYAPVLQGNYIVAVEVKEFRNGLLIGRTRRDLQLQAIPCPANNAPAPNTPFPLTYAMDAGDVMCFSIEYMDVDTDSLSITWSGSIFDSTVVSPQATLTVEPPYPGGLKADVCWNPPCEAGQDQPYLFSVSVTDNGCPPKTLDMVFQIQVYPFEGPTAINGPVQVCMGGGGAVYTTDSISGATYNWQVNGGTIVSGQGGPSITVDWSTPGTGTVTVNATNNLGCTDGPVNLMVNVISPPTAEAGLDATICPGAGTVIGGSPTGPAGSTVLWVPASGLDDASGANPQATPDSTTLYVVQVADSGCTATDTVLITVQIPTVDAGADVSACDGDTAQLNATGIGLFSWSPSDGLSATDIADPQAAPGATTTYQVTLTDSLGCTATDSVVVTVNSFGLNINLSPATTSGCQNESMTFTALPDSSGFTYSWNASGGISVSGINGNSALVTWTGIGAGELTVQANDPNGCSQTIITPFNTLAVPDVNAGPDTTICAGESVQLHGTGNGTLQWSPITGLSDPNIADPIANPELTQTYTLTVTGGNLCVNTDQVTVTVNVLPNANAGPDLQLCLGDSIQLQASGPGTYNWTPDSTLSDANDTNPWAFPTTTTTYTLTLSDSTACSNVDEVTVSVTTPPDPGTGGSASLCGSGVPFTLLDSLGGTPEPGGTWTAPDNSTHGPVFDPAADLAGTWTYTLPGIGACPDASAPLQVTVIVPNAQVTGDNSICVGDTTQLTNTGNVAWTWSPGTGISDTSIADPFFFPENTTLYTLMVTDANGCTATTTVEVSVNAPPTADAGTDAAICADNSVTIGGSPTGPSGSTFAWSPDTGLSSATAANPIASPQANTTYTVLVTDGNGCSMTDSVSISVNPLPTVDAGSDVSACTGGSVQLNATGTGSFSWSPPDGLSATDIADPVASPTVATTYTVTVTDGNGCSASDDITVAVAALPTVDAGPDLYLCPGYSVQLQGNGSGTPTWSPGGTVSAPDVFDPEAAPLTNTTYTLTITDGNGCTATDETTVTVSDEPPVDAGADQSTCAGQPVVLGGAPTTSVPGASVVWSPSTGIDDPTSFNPNAAPEQTTQYTVTVTSDTCTSQDMVTVSVEEGSEAGFSIRLEPNCDDIRAFLTDLSTGASQWLWDFGDGTTSTEQFPQHHFAYGSDIVVTLTVTDGSGCENSITQTYPATTFSELISYEVPNIFTPNGDGKNDVFKMNTEVILGACLDMKVFNRWGQKVFESDGGNVEWGGRNFAGEQCVTGTYFWTITIKDMAFSGSVYLNR